jgi:hypothetical protein
MQLKPILTYGQVVAGEDYYNLEDLRHLSFKESKGHRDVADTRQGIPLLKLLISSFLSCGRSIWYIIVFIKGNGNISI